MESRCNAAMPSGPLLLLADVGVVGVVTGDAGPDRAAAAAAAVAFAVVGSSSSPAPAPL